MSEIHVDIYTRARLIAQAERIKELEASLFLCEAANANARLERTEMRELLERVLDCEAMEYAATMNAIEALLERTK